MCRSSYSFTLALLLVAASWAYAADIAIVDYADEWNRQACVGSLLDDLGKDYDDITDQVENGNLNLDAYKILIIGSFATNNPTLHTSLDANAGEIEEFLARGGIVIELTQADQNQANIDWLPGTPMAPIHVYWRRLNEKGRILLLSIALDKKHTLGTTTASLENSMLMMENILTEFAVAVDARAKSATTWAKVKL